jgi:hypothetical protein
MIMTPIHLPKSLQQAFVDNLWWLAIARLGAGVVMLGVLGNVNDTASASAQILLIMFGAITLLTIPAISPLKKQKKLGWLLFFLTMIIQAFGVTASLIASSNPILFGAVAGALVGGYILLDIRSYYK